MKARDVVRGLIFDSAGSLFLLRWRDPHSGWEFWEPPGGGRDEGESHEDALRREIAEETGITQFRIVGPIRDVEHHFTYAGHDYHCFERYFTCQLTGDALSEPRRQGVEESGIIDTRWLSIEEILEVPREQLEPPELLDMLLSRRD